MKINKFQKLKNGNYKIYLEEEKIEVHEDLILKYDLLITKSLSEKQKEEILEDQKVYDVYNKALKYIQVKMRTKKELEAYLLKKEYKLSDIKEAINILETQGYINNEMYINAYIHDRIVLSNDGPLKIIDDLKKNGVQEKDILDKLTSYDEYLEKERIEKLINKYIKTIHNKSKTMLKKKIEMNLINLGYHKSLINEKLNSVEIDDQEEYKKEYDKQLKKLSKKYSGKELEYKLKQKLYEKGFKISE